jgi:hypothetical protein
MNNARLRVSIVVCLVLFVTACAGMRHRDTVRAGILKAGTTQQAFLDVWGPPDSTRNIVSDTEEKRLEFSRFGGFYGRSNTTYEIWEYKRREVTLIFQRERLSGWKTDKTTEQLRSD